LERLLDLYLGEITYFPLYFFDVLFNNPWALQLAFCENPILRGDVDKQYFLDIDGIFIFKGIFILNF
jgi:hypothetical protein